MSEEYYTVQHPPFFVSDQRAINVICKEIGIEDITQFWYRHNMKASANRLVAAYVLKLYTGMTLHQIATTLKMPYVVLVSEVNKFEKRIKSNKLSLAARLVNRIINKL